MSALSGEERAAFDLLFRAWYDSRERRESCSKALERLIGQAERTLQLEHELERATAALYQQGLGLSRMHDRLCEAMKLSPTPLESACALIELLIEREKLDVHYDYGGGWQLSGFRNGDLREAHEEYLAAAFARLGIEP